ncbi:MAG: hypothetical protein B7733_22340, partial [Myxococcales bacterium FL481]
MADSRFEPRNTAARAYADSLVALGDVERARGVLIRDFRHGGHVESLVALADLEAREGRWGMATVNYARVTALDAMRLSGREDVCGAFRRRARDLLALGDAVAADHDLRRVVLLCGTSPEPAVRQRDAELWERVEAQSETQVRAQRTLDSAAWLEQTAGPTPAANDRVTPAQQRERARRERRSLEPAEVIALLVAETRGQTGLELIDDAELRGLIGFGDWSAFAPRLTGLPASLSAYVRVRLAAVLSSVPGAETVAGRDQLLARSVGGGGVADAAPIHRVRVAAVQSSAALSELALRGELLGPPTPAESADTGSTAVAPPLAASPSVAHWGLGVEVSPRTAGLLALLARLRGARRWDAATLAIARQAIGAAGVAEARDEIRRALVHGRPWSALALAAAAPADLGREVWGAIGVALSLQRAVCDGACSEEQRDDRGLASVVLGEAELAAFTERAVQTARAGQRPAADSTPVEEAACGAMAQVVLDPSQSALGGILRRSPVDQAPAAWVGILARALESDPALGCVGRWVTPLLADAMAEVTARTLADRLGMAPELESSAQLELHAQLALVAGQPSRARRLAIESAAV